MYYDQFSNIILFNYLLYFIKHYCNFVITKSTKMSTLEFENKLHGLTSSLNAFAYNLTKNSEEAKDLYQETAIRAITNKEKFNPGTNLKAWLFTIMKNIFINNYRKKMKKNTIIDNTDNMYFINSGSHIIDNDAGRNILMSELNKMIKNLDENFRIPFEMHFDGYKYQEISDELSLPLGTVKSRIFFARKELKKQIQKQYGDLSSIREKLIA